MIDLRSAHVFQELAATTVGLTTSYPIRDPGPAIEVIPAHLLPDGFDARATQLPLTYLDSTASAKMIGPVYETLLRILEHYANSHSVTHGAARISTHYLEEAHHIVGRFVNAPSTHVPVFVGNGATGGTNRVARTLFANGTRSKRDTVVFTAMEHHANILPWLKHAPRTVPVPIDPDLGTLSLDRLEDTLKKNRNRTRLVAVTGISNVTGIKNDIAAIARMAHEIGAEILVDAAQMAAHHRIDMLAWAIDYLVFSGHKIYAPLSPGVLVMPAEASPAIPDEVGGGIVLSVDLDRFLVTSQLPAREEAGTPNIVGAILLAKALQTLMGIGMDRVWEHELQLVAQLMGGLAAMDGVKVYGDNDLTRTPRAGVVSFSVEGLHHAIVAQALADYFNIAVRNECFCAHPYVKALKKMGPAALAQFEADALAGDRRNSPGMARPSQGAYTLPEDIQRLHPAVRWIFENRERLGREYEVTRDGTAIRNDGWAVRPEDFKIL